MWLAATSPCLATFTCPLEDSCHTPAARSSGKNINTNNAFHYYTCSGACCGQLAWHHEALRDQKERNNTQLSYEVINRAEEPASDRWVNRTSEITVRVNLKKSKIILTSVFSLQAII